MCSDIHIKHLKKGQWRFFPSSQKGKDSVLYHFVSFLSWCVSKLCKHPHPLKIYEQSPNFPHKEESKMATATKKNHQRTLPKTKRTPKESVAVENRQSLAGHKNPVLKSPSFNCSESLCSKPQLVMQGWEHQMSPQHRLSFLQDHTAAKPQKYLFRQISQCSSYFVS